MTGRHDPGEPAAAGDPAVSQVIYALRDLGVEGPGMAEDVLEAANVAAWLSDAQIDTVLAAYRPLTGPDDPMHDEGDEDPDGVSWAERPAGRPAGGPGYVPPDQRGAELRRIAPVEFAPPEQRSG